MNLAIANLIALLFSFAAAIMIGSWYLVPACQRRPLGSALVILLWFQAFRYVALQIFAAHEVGGLRATTAAQRIIAFGDLATAAIALVAIWALHHRAAAGRHLALLAGAVGAADLVSATVTGIGQNLVDTATDLSWLILACYVPILWVTTVILLRQLYTRRTEPLYPTETRDADDPNPESRRDAT